MDPAVLTGAGFWQAGGPAVAAGGFPGSVPETSGLRGHVLFESSGSMGSPKWVALSKTALMASAEAVNRHLEADADSCWGLALPLNHVGGFGVAARAFQAGCRLERYDGKWDAAGWADWVERCGVSHTSLVPTQVHDLVGAGLRAGGSVRAIVVGGGRLDESTGRAARELGWPVLASYGMTEAGSQIATQGFDSLQKEYRAAPVPVLPMWRVEAGDDGLCRIKGPGLFSGYVVACDGGWEFRARCGEWFQTEDRVDVGLRGLSPLGRGDGLVKVLGELVDPAGVERELAELARGDWAPESFVVVAVPDARAGNRLVPVFDGRRRPVRLAEVLAAYHRDAPGFRRLADPVVLDGFPRSALGKARRGVIRERIGADRVP